MVLLQFAVPGFSKCGTTTLCELLRKHPRIYISAEKEPAYFTANFGFGMSWYEQHFREAQPGQVLGDGSTEYGSREFAAQAAERLLAHNPHMKFIFIARHPMRRLESSFREMHHSGHRYAVEADYDFGRTLAAFPNMLADSRYWSLINVYRKLVPDERILVLLLEDFERNPAVELRRCFQFLGVDPNIQVENLRKKYNSGAEKLYDSPLLRFVRRRRWTNRWWEQLSPAAQERWSKRLGLRKPFCKPVEWKPETLARVQAELGEEMQQFLTFYGRAPDFWSWRLAGEERGAQAA